MRGGQPIICTEMAHLQDGVGREKKKTYDTKQRTKSSRNRKNLPALAPAFSLYHTSRWHLTPLLSSSRLPSSTRDSLTRTSRSTVRSLTLITTSASTSRARTLSHARFSSRHLARCALSIGLRGGTTRERLASSPSAWSKLPKKRKSSIKEASWTYRTYTRNTHTNKEKQAQGEQISKTAYIKSSSFQPSSLYAGSFMRTFSSVNKSA